MVDLCPTCKRLELAKGEQFIEGKHCPDSKIMRHLLRDQVSCLTIGIELRDMVLQRSADNFRRTLRIIDDLYALTEPAAAEGGDGV